MYKNRILNLIILALILGILGVGGNIIYKNYQYDCEKYNNEIIDFTVELIKGHHTLEDIDALDANDDVKNSLREYYQNTFYSDDDMILVYEDIDKLENSYAEAKEIQESIPFKYGTQEYDYAIEELFIDVLYGDNSENALNFENNAENNRATILKILQNCNFSIDVKTDTFLVKENNNLYISINDLNFSNGIMSVYYNGVKFDIYRDTLNKKIRSELLNDMVFQSYERKNVFEEDGLFVVMLKDSLSNTIYFRYDISFGKLNSLQL